MSDLSIKMIYIPAQHRVRVELSRFICSQSDQPPSDLMDRAVIKLEKEVDLGNLEFYRFFETRLCRLWKILRESKIPEHEKVGLTVATGSPSLPGIQVEPVLDKKLLKLGVISKISLTASAKEISSWRFKTFKLKVGYMLRQRHIMDVASASQLYGLWYRASSGVAIHDELLYSTHGSEKNIKDKIYTLELTRRGDVVFRLFRMDFILGDENFEDIIKDARDFAAKASSKIGGSFNFLTTNLVRNLRSATRGPERFGLDLPVVLLAALNQKSGLMIGDPEKLLPRYSKKIPNTSTQKILENSFQIYIGENSQEAYLSTKKNIDWKQLKDLKIEQWSAFLRVCYIDPSTAQGSFSFLQNIVIEESYVQDHIIATAKDPVPGKVPYFHLSHQDKNKKLKINQGEEIGRISYQSPPENGKDVRGQPIDLSYPEHQDLMHLGEGVEYRNGVYYAQYDGMIELEPAHLSVTKVTIFEGNLNSLSGHFFCTSPVEIRGNVEKGMMVHVSGDLHITGLVEGAMILCHGHLTVDGGVLADSYVRSDGRMKIGFADNSRVMTQESLFVRESLISSYVLAEKNIHFEKKESSILGGELHWGNLLKCANIGTETGQVTTLNGGGSPFLTSLQICDAERVEYLNKYIKPFERNLKDLRARRPEQMGLKQKKRKEELISFLDKIKRIILKIEERMKKRSRDIITTRDASMKVSGELSTNCNLRLSGSFIPIRRVYMSVHVIAGDGSEIMCFLQNS
ncbi:MAG: FapA family protein [Oligoflexales bacterium]